MFSKISLCVVFLGTFAVQAGLAVADDTDRMVFRGEASGRTGVFETEGPWTLDWTTRSDTPLSATFEMRLLDGATGDFVGRIIEMHGVGRGLKLFEQGGSFQIAVVASSTAWDLRVSEVSKEQANELKRLSDSERSLQDSTRAELRLIRDSTFSNWRPEGDSALLLFDDNELRWRATFAEPCPGLGAAKAISFVTPTSGSLEDFDSIMLDDGTRCYFDRVVPSAVE